MLEKLKVGEKTCMRAFVQFCYEPIRRVIDAAMNDNKDKLWPMLEKLKVKEKLKPADFDLLGKPLMKRIMQTWLPADVALLEMIIYHLPSPATAQKYRATPSTRVPSTISTPRLSATATRT